MSATVHLGGNEFADCAAIVEIRGEPVLRVDVDPLRITMSTPPGWNGAQAISVADNALTLGAPRARVFRAGESVVVLSGDVPIVTAIADPDRPGSVLLRLDLRPLGISLFDDAAGLHVGPNVFTGNRVSSAASAISLA